MNKRNKVIVAAIEVAHLAIYFVMVMALFFTLYCAVTGYFSWLLYIAVTLLLVEGAVLIANKWRCPVTFLAERYGAEKGYVFHVLFSEKVSRLLLNLYVLIFVVSMVLLFGRFLID